jgi:hypothetical protein
MSQESIDFGALASEPLCIADFEVEGGVFSLGASPFGERRVGYITGGAFYGPRLKGKILPGGGNWSTAGRISAEAACGTFDARSIWRTDDGADIYVSYAGRSVIPDAVTAKFRDPNADPVDRALYYLRIAPVFETSAPAYAWLNGVLAVSGGERMPWGVRHRMFAIL